VAVLIGPETFSSAVQNAAELKQELKAKLVGEPTGGLPSGYGEVKTLTLPYSKVIVRYTTKNFGRPHGDVLRPDISAPRTLADALHGRDPVLEAALAALN
jgi:C-terminal processing protease CtpA/Prc